MISERPQPLYPIKTGKRTITVAYGIKQTSDYVGAAERYMDSIEAKVAEHETTIGELKKLLVGASLALRSYQGFTGSTADAIDEALSKQVQNG
jgi:hypothetical protein